MVLISERRSRSGALLPMMPPVSCCADSSCFSWIFSCASSTLRRNMVSMCRCVACRFFKWVKSWCAKARRSVKNCERPAAAALFECVGRFRPTQAIICIRRVVNRAGLDCGAECSSREGAAAFDADSGAVIVLLGEVCLGSSDRLFSRPDREMVLLLKCGDKLFVRTMRSGNTIGFDGDQRMNETNRSSRDHDFARRSAGHSEPIVLRGHDRRRRRIH